MMLQCAHNGHFDHCFLCVYPSIHAKVVIVYNVH